MEQAENFELFDTVAVRFVHELRTPVATIVAGAGCVSEALPQLVDVYRMAKTNGLHVPDIQPEYFLSLLRVLKNIEGEGHRIGRLCDQFQAGIKKYQAGFYLQGEAK